MGRGNEMRRGKNVFWGLLVDMWCFWGWEEDKRKSLYLL
jgi:hypothetical protein